MSIDDLPERFRAQIRKQLAAGAATGVPRKEPDRQAALGEAPKNPRFHKAVRVIVSQWRRGSNWDSDNIETKAIIDGLVEAGVIAGDTIKTVPEVNRRGFQCLLPEEERTEVLIEEI